MFFPTGLMTFGQFCSHILNAEALACKQNYEVIKHVRAFVDETVVGAVGGFDDEFERLLSHLLSHAVETILEEAGGVGAFGHLFMTFVDEILQFSEEKQRVAFVGLIPTGIGTSMTNGASWIDFDKKGIVIAIVEDFDYAKDVARGLTFGPKAITSAAPEGNETSLNGFFVGFAIHEAEHEDLVGHSILDDSGHQALEFVEIDLHSFIGGYDGL